MKQKLLLKTMLLLCILVGGASNAWADTQTKNETFNFSTSGCSGWTTDHAGSYCGGYGRNKNGSYFVANSSISNFSGVDFSAVNTPSVTIYVKALTNAGTNTYTVSLIDKDGKVVGTSATKTDGMGSGSNAASASESSVVLTPGSGVTGYRIDFPAKSAITQTRYTLTYDPAPATPTFSPVAGDFSSDFTLTLSSATDGATIYYTTDGSTPTSSSTAYDPANKPTISAGADVTVKAIAIKGGVSSSVATATYTYKNIANPVFGTADGSTVLYGESVAITCATDGAKIYYTTNGDTPTSSSTEYSAPIVLTAGTTIKAISIKGSDESDVVSATYTVKATAPTFSVAEGTFNAAQSVELNCTTVGATIYYTTDGSTPTNESTAYSSAISVDVTKTIKAIAIKDGLTNSDVASATYTLKCATPTFSIAAGDFDDAQDVEILCLTDGVSIYYTLNGSMPTSSSTAYTGTAIEISDIKTLKAIATKSGWSDSDVASAEYRVVVPASLPFSFDKGKSDIATTTGLTQTGLGNDYSSKPYLKFDGTDDCLILKFNACPNVLSFDIKGNGFSGGTFKVQYSADGSSYTDLKSYGNTELSDNEKHSETFNTIPVSTRFIKWIYTEKSNGNVGLGNISLTGTQSVSITAAKYATYCFNKALDFSATDVKAYVAASDGSKVTLTEIEDGIVPANAGVVLYCETANTYSIPVTASDATDYSGLTNELIGITTRTKVAYDGEGSKKNYILANEAAGIGFYKADATGAYLPANRAYLSTENVSTARYMGFELDDETTGISTMHNSQCIMHNDVFDLQGRKIAQPKKGLYIKNGKKVFVK